MCVDAYTENSMFSLTCFIPGRKANPQDTLHLYKSNSRNLNIIKNEGIYPILRC